MNINLELGLLEYYCLMDADSLMDELPQTVVVNRTGRPHGFTDNGSDVLAVVHLDTVMKGIDLPFAINGDRVVSHALDDRLGLWIILEILPQLGVVCDVLFTTDEEIGRSTASDFRPTKDYKWIFSFDRRGTDVVMYDYETDELVSELGYYGWEIGSGSYSDICYLEHLGVTGFNFGAGYHLEHTVRCWANLTDSLVNAQLFANFYRDYSSVKLEFDYKSSPYYYPFNDELEEQYYKAMERDYLKERREFECAECLLVYPDSQRSTYDNEVCIDCARVALDLPFS